MKLEKLLFLLLIEFGALSAIPASNLQERQQSLLKKVEYLSAGADHSCAIFDDMSVKCWGENKFGQLGLGDSRTRGLRPDDMGTFLPTVKLGSGRQALTISSGGRHTCTLLDDRSVKCWGNNWEGILGQGDEETRGDDPNEMGDNLPAIKLGAEIVDTLDAGGAHTCSIFFNGAVKCWGNNSEGQLGMGDTVPRGNLPNQMGENLPPIDLGSGRRALSLSAGNAHTCVILDDHSVKCWGSNMYGQLGLEDSNNRGNKPNQMGDNLATVDLGKGRKAMFISAGGFHTCAILDDGSLKCWGLNRNGELGQGDIIPRGTRLGSMGDKLSAVDLGDSKRALSVSAGFSNGVSHTCSLLNDRTIKCWGANGGGSLGIGHYLPWGNFPKEMGNELPTVNLALPAKAISVGNSFTCAVLVNSAVKCWGYGGTGKLGLGDSLSRGGKLKHMGNELPFVNL